MPFRNRWIRLRQKSNRIDGGPEKVIFVAILTIASIAFFLALLRYLAFYDRDFYHFGASIKDAGKRAFMFSVIEEPDIIASIRAKFEHEWNNAKVEI